MTNHQSDSGGHWPGAGPVSELAGFNVLVHGRHGLFVVNRNDIYIGRSLIAYGEFSELEWLLLAQMVEPGDVAVEVGANIGSLTVPLAQAVGPTGRVVAVEPQPIVHQTLCANLALNGLTNVDAVHGGCGREPGEVRIPSYDYSAAGNFGGIALADAPTGTPVPVSRLDDLFAFPRLKLIKVDVEGMEAEVIEGARRTIEAHRPLLYLENDRASKSAELVALVRSLGYRLWWHAPPLFNQDNFRGNRVNVFGDTISLNVLAVHRESDVNVEYLTEVDDSLAHPFAGRR